MVNWIADLTDQMNKDVVCFLEMILLPLELVCIKTSSHSCHVEYVYYPLKGGVRGFMNCRPPSWSVYL